MVIYPLVMTNIALEDGTFIADLPVKDGDFPVRHVNVYQGVDSEQIIPHVCCGKDPLLARSAGFFDFKKPDDEIDILRHLTHASLSSPAAATALVLFLDSLGTDPDTQFWGSSTKQKNMKGHTSSNSS